MRAPRRALRLSERSATARRRQLGLVFAVAIAVVVALGVTRPNPFVSTHTVRAVFDETGSLGQTLRDVRMGGVNVGEVKAERRIGDDVELELVLDEPSARPIYRDARAEIRPHLLFEGTVYVELYPGSPSTGELGERPIPRANTRLYVPLGEAVKALDRPRRDAVQQTMRELSGGLGGGAPASLQQTLRNAPPLTEDLEPAARAARGPYRGALASAIRGMAATTTAVAREEERISSLVRDAEQTFAAAAVDDTAPLDATIRALPPALVELDRGGKALERILTELRPFAAAADPTLRELTPLLREARPLLREARPTLRRARPLLRDLQTALDRTADAAPEVLALAEALEPSLDLLDRSLLPELRRESRLGIPLYLQLLDGFSGAAGLARFYETPQQSEYGPGHGGRVQPTFLSTLPGGALPLCSELGSFSPQLTDQLVELGVCRT